jgi:GT2 family glycosyltransferase
MLGSFYRIFLRYRDETLRLERDGMPLIFPHTSGDFDGLRIDRIGLHSNRLVVEGWCRAERIGIRLNRTLLWVTPELARPGDDLRGFTLDIPFEPGRPDLLLAGQEQTPLSLPTFSRPALWWGGVARWLPYIRSVVLLVPQIWRWKLGGDLGAREVIKEGLHLVPRSEAVEMSDAVFIPAPDTATPFPFAAVTVVIPVFNAFETLAEVLTRADAHADMPLRVVLIEDCSTDPRVRPFLAQWAHAPERRAEVQLILNDSNMGFIGSVNRGLVAARAWPDDPVVLLNSDAMVPPDWTRRLLAPLADGSVASVTPMSNDAEIFNVPVICRPGSLEPGVADRIDAEAHMLNPQAARIEAPTGVGFCMALSPRFLARVPALDTAFGRGYGEETDWCQKTRALGGRHLGISNLFVEHRAGSSFGSAAKRQLLERNGAEVSRRYPHYDREVQAFIRHDPMVTARLALGLAWAAASQSTPVPVYLGHAMGGGAESDLRRRIGHDIAAGGSAVVLRVGQGHRWKLELHSPLGLTQGLSNDEALIRALIARLPRRHIVYSCGVGDRDPVTLPDLLLDMAGRGAHPLPGGQQPLEVLVHDFFMISPSYTLLGKDGHFHGLPLPGTPAGKDPAHRIERPGGLGVDLADWQASWGRLMAAATDITVFSDSSHALVARAYPTAARTINLRPHSLLADIPLIAPTRRADGRPVIGVLGNIGQQKGAAVVQSLSRDLARRGDAGLVVIGHLDPAYRLASPAAVHGSYEWRDLPGLVARYGISAWFIPSVWPETFSFTTHEAIATGMPVFCFDLGAQADALRASLDRGGAGAILALDRPLSMLLDRLNRSAGNPHIDA